MHLPAGPARPDLVAPRRLPDRRASAGARGGSRPMSRPSRVHAVAPCAGVASRYSGFMTSLVPSAARPGGP